MSAYYTYFISTLPTLHFGMNPPFSLAKLLKDCQDFISDQDFAILKNLPVTMDEYDKNPNQPTIEEWLNFDTALRNELARVRAQTKKVEAEKFLRPVDVFNAHVLHLASSAHRNPAILEAEKILDRARWEKLEELSLGHYFDIDFLILYAYKLRILERWEKIEVADKQALLQEALSRE